MTFHLKVRKKSTFAIFVDKDKKRKLHFNSFFQHLQKEIGTHHLKDGLDHWGVKRAF